MKKKSILIILAVILVVVCIGSTIIIVSHNSIKQSSSETYAWSRYWLQMEDDGSFILADILSSTARNDFKKLTYDWSGDTLTLNFDNEYLLFNREGDSLYFEKTKSCEMEQFPFPDKTEFTKVTEK